MITFFLVSNHRSRKHFHVDFILFSGIVTNKTTNIGYITGPISGDRIYLRYYQWIVCVYLGMIVTFTLPAALWRYLEGRRIKSLCDELGK